MASYAHVAGFDDAPFPAAHRGDVMVVATIYSGLRLEGVLSTRVRRDGANSTRNIAALLSGSRFRDHVQLVLLQGVAFAGFNVVDVRGLHASLGTPVATVARRPPDLGAIRRALVGKVPGGHRKWKLIERLGPMEQAADVWVQRAGIASADLARTLKRLAVNGSMPEPLRAAHLIAAGVTVGESRHRP